MFAPYASRVLYSYSNVGPWATCPSSCGNALTSLFHLVRASVVAPGRLQGNHTPDSAVGDSRMGVEDFEGLQDHYERERPTRQGEEAAVRWDARCHKRGATSRAYPGVHLIDAEARVEVRQRRDRGPDLHERPRSVPRQPVAAWRRRAHPTA